jgi:hypothetical protein
MQSWYRRYGSWLLGGLFLVAFSAAGAWLLWAIADQQQGRLPTFAYSPLILRPAPRRAAPAVTGGQMTQRLQGAGATMGGDLEVSLAWDGLSDFDLEVQGPTGERVNARHWRGANGGVQDVDANPTLIDSTGQARVDASQIPGADTIQPLPDFLVDMDDKMGLPGEVAGLLAFPAHDGKAPTRFTRHPVEHTYYEHAPPGTYLVYVHCYSWREASRTPLAYIVQARHHGKVFYEQPGTLGPASYAVEGAAPVVACRLTLP